MGKVGMLRTHVPQSPPQMLLQMPFSHSPGTVGADTIGADTIGADAFGADTTGADAVGADAVGADAVGAATIGVATIGVATVGADMLNSSGGSALEARCRRSNSAWLERRRYVSVLLN